MSTSKLRAWNSETKKWELPTNVLVELSGQVIHIHRDEEPERRMLNCVHIHVDRFTGGEDANEQPIFENDIVRVSLDNPLGRQDGIGIVVQESTQFSVEFPEEGTTIGLDAFFSDDGYIRVVGNIYQNGEDFEKWGNL